MKVYIHVLMFALIVQTFSLEMQPELSSQQNNDRSKIDRSIAKQIERKRFKMCCPKMCNCSELYDAQTIIIKDCSKDPTEELTRVLSTDCPYNQYGIVRAKLSSVPCKALSQLPRTFHLDLSENSIQTFFCESVEPNSLFFLNASHNKIEKEPIITYWNDLRHIDFSYNNMSAVPCGIRDFHFLQRLDLSHNVITKVACNLSGTSLQVLNMTHNQLQSFPCNMSTLTGLLHLNLSYNHIDAISCITFNLPYLRVLDLSHNDLNTVRFNLIGLPRLITLNLNRNHIEVMPCALSVSSALQALYLSNNNLTTAPNCLGSLPLLKTLDLSWNYLKVVPCDLLMSSSLEWIWMRHNLLEDIKCNLTKMSALSSFDLSHNRFTTMPCNLSPQENLRVLDISHNQIHSVFCNLKYPSYPRLSLNLGYNDLLTFPCNLTTFNGDHLDVSHNVMHVVACKFPQTAVSSLNMSYNNFKTLPCELSVPGILTLDMSHNEIQTIECDLSHMEMTFLLNLDYNNLGTIPCNLDSLPDAIELSLNHNHIKRLPSCLKNLPRLKTLRLAYNEISIIENMTFSSLEGLYHIELNNNNITTIEVGVFKDCKYLYQVHLENNILQTMESWPHIYNRPPPLIQVYASNNELSTFSNSARAPLISCLSLFPFPDVLFSMDGNDIRHIMDLFNGWNLKVNETDEIYACMEVFNFSNNPLICDCVDYGIYAAIHNNIYLSRNLTCSKPHDLKGLNPGFVPLDKFVCNVSDKCPEGCLCYDTPHTRDLSVICTEYTEVDLPNKLPQLLKYGYLYYLRWKQTNINTVSYRPYLTDVAEAIFSNNIIKHVTLEALLSLNNASKIYFDNNHLTHLPHNFTSATLGPHVEMRLGNNLWECDCTAVSMKVWLVKNHEKIQDLTDVRCFIPPNTRGKLMIDVDNSVMCPPHSKPIPVLAILGGIILFLVICLPVVCVLKVKRGVRVHERIDMKPIDWDEEVDNGKEFDVFVSYATEDEDYVEVFLISELENRGFKVCFHRVHFIGGKSIIDNISECLDKSKTFLAFYSMNYKDSYFGMYEFTLALHLDIENGTNRLVAIKDTDLDVESLQSSHCTYMRTHSYVIKGEPNFWRNLSYTLPKHKLGRRNVNETEV